MSYFVYVLRSLKNGRFYTGYTQNLDRRLQEHNSGQSSYTKLTRPFKLVYKESFKNKKEAMKRERDLKTGKGREEIRKKLNIISEQ